MLLGLLLEKPMRGQQIREVVERHCNLSADFLLSQRWLHFSYWNVEDEKDGTLAIVFDGIDDFY
jgi:hypothetical protein